MTSLFAEARKIANDAKAALEETTKELVQDFEEQVGEIVEASKANAQQIAGDAAKLLGTEGEEEGQDGRPSWKAARDDDDLLTFAEEEDADLVAPKKKPINTPQRPPRPASPSNLSESSSAALAAVLAERPRKAGQASRSIPPSTLSPQPSTASPKGADLQPDLVASSINAAGATPSDTDIKEEDKETRLRKKLEETEGRLQVQQEIVQERELEVARLKQLVRDMDDDHKSRGTRHAIELAQVHATLEEKSCQHDALQKQLRTASRELRTATQATKDTEEREQKKIAECEDLQEQLKNLQEQLEQLASVSEQSFLQSDAARSTEASSKVQLAEALEREQALQSQLEKSNADLAAAKSERDAAKEEFTKMKQKDELVGGLLSRQPSPDDELEGSPEERMYRELEKKTEQLKESEHRLEVMISRYEEIERQNFALKLKVSGKKEDAKPEETPETSSARRASSAEKTDVEGGGAGESGAGKDDQQAATPTGPLATALKSLPPQAAEILVVLYAFACAMAIWIDDRMKYVAAVIGEQKQYRRVFFTHLALLYLIVAYWYSYYEGDTGCASSELTEALPARPDPPK